MREAHRKSGPDRGLWARPHGQKAPSSLGPVPAALPGCHCQANSLSAAPQLGPVFPWACGQPDTVTVAAGGGLLWPNRASSPLRLWAFGPGPSPRAGSACRRPGEAENEIRK